MPLSASACRNSTAASSPRSPPGGFILDAGCGSGRDARAFREKGFSVYAFDACPELAALAAAHADIPVEVRTFADVDEEQRYDGVWACASLLHVPREHLPDALNRLWRALRPGGAFYLSFRPGAGDRLGVRRGSMAEASCGNGCGNSDWNSTQTRRA
jgi:2-polyprenyl-3-methyl-5-hydroxy-6-metoxy-1,4-benzoquinol methylase